MVRLATAAGPSAHLVPADGVDRRPSFGRRSFAIGPVK